jgi:hypothetical protein
VTPESSRRRLDRLEAKQEQVDADAAHRPDPGAALIERLETLQSRLAMSNVLPEPPEIRQQRERESVVRAARRQRAARAEVRAHLEGRWRPPWPMTATQSAACYEAAVAELEGAMVQYGLLSSLLMSEVNHADLEGEDIHGSWD